MFVCGSSSDCVSEWVLPPSVIALIGLACSLAGWAACSLVFLLLRRLDGRSSENAAFVCVRALDLDCSLVGWTNNYEKRSLARDNAVRCAIFIIRQAQSEAFSKNFRGTLASDVILEIPKVVNFMLNHSESEEDFSKKGSFWNIL